MLRYPTAYRRHEITKPTINGEKAPATIFPSGAMRKYSQDKTCPKHGKVVADIMRLQGDISPMPRERATLRVHQRLVTVPGLKEYGRRSGRVCYRNDPTKKSVEDDSKLTVGPVDRDPEGSRGRRLTY